MGSDAGIAGGADGLMRVGRTPVRAKMFARVAGIRVVAHAGSSAPVTLTSWYEGIMTLPGTPGAAAVTAALAQEDGHVNGTVVLALSDPGTAGVYAVEGRIRGRRFLLQGTSPLGAHFRWRGRLTEDRGVRGPVRITLHDVQVAGVLALWRKGAPGPCGSARFAGAVTADSSSTPEAA